MNDVDTTRIKKLFYEKLEVEKSATTVTRKRIGLRAVILAAAILCISAVSAFTATGGLEQFLARFNPSFGEFAIAPLYPAYAIDRDIRIEVVGAQQIDNVVLLYVIMQDISGENRLTRHMMPDIEVAVNGEIVSTGAGSGRRLRFDSATNTAYIERIVGVAVGTPREDAIELVVNNINCFEHGGQVRRAFTGEWRTTVNTSDLGIQPIVWTDVSAGNLHIEYMALTPFGLRLEGSHSYGYVFPFLDMRLEFENRRRDYTFRGFGGGFSSECFSYSARADSPIDIDDVVAVIIQGERIPVE